MASKLPIGNRGRPAKPLAKINANLKRRQNRPLNDAQRRFVERYLVHFNSGRAYREAYPEALPSTAETGGPALRRDPRISSEIRRSLAAIAKQSRHSAARTLNEIAKLAFSDMGDYFDANGCLIPLHDLPRHVTAALKKLKLGEIRRVDNNGNQKVIERTVAVELCDKVAALKMLWLHYGLSVPRVEVARGRDFAEALRAARDRVLAASKSG